MSSPTKEDEEPSSSGITRDDLDARVGSPASPQKPRPPAKRRLSSTVIEISDTESDDSDICAVNSYQASADEVKRIRGADYSSTSSSSDYSSDSESPWEDDSILVECDKIGIKPVRAHLNPRANRTDDPKLNPIFKTEEAIERLQTHWKEMKDYKEGGVTLTSEPFRLCLLHNFLENPDIINNIVDDMNTLDWSRKKMDLYEFHQTADLASLTWQRSIRGIYELLKTEVRNWVSLATGLPLATVSASCSLYGPGDQLAAHDDRLADRRVAFILYLCPWTLRRPPHRRNGTTSHSKLSEVCSEIESPQSGWGSSAGGALELLSADKVVRRVLPENNLLAFFQVNEHSFHQVSEVLSLELPRLSINGWFHGPPPFTGIPRSVETPPAAETPPTAETPPAEDAPPLSLTPPAETPPSAVPPPSPPQPLHTQVVVLSEWVDPTYMSPRSRAQLQAHMEVHSEACLQGLLLQDRLQELLTALQAPEVEWEWVGPRTSRHYERVCWRWAEQCAHPAAGLLRLASSAAFARLLADCTDLPLARASRPELRRMTPHTYTLLPPREHYQSSRLEAVLYLGVPDRKMCGGSTMYVSPEEGGEDGTLVTVPPVNNSLALVYCDPGAAGFTKYLGLLTLRDHPCIYMLTCSYYE